MKARSSITPAILVSDSANLAYNIDIDLGEGKTVSMTFTDRRMAQDYYNITRAQGIFSGLWIRSIQLKEITK